MRLNPARRSRVVAVLSLGLAVAWVAAMVAAPSVGAKPAATTVRLGMTGMVTPANPHGTWSLRARPGQTLGFVAGLVPGLDHLDVDSVLSVQVSMDAQHLPGGSRGKSLKPNAPYRLTLHQPGSYPLHWTVAFVLGHGHKSNVEATRQFNGTVIVGRPTSGNSPGLVSSGSSSSPPARVASPAAASHNVVTPHQAASTTGSAAAQPASSPPPTFTLPPDSGATHRANPGAIAALPLATTTDTYLFTAIVGTFVLGFLWLLWVASIKPILGR